MSTQQIQEPIDLQPLSIEAVDKIDSILQITTSTKMDMAILKNTASIIKLCHFYLNKLYFRLFISKENSEQLLSCLNFIECVNLFMSPSSLSQIQKYLNEIFSKMSGNKAKIPSKDMIIKRIKNVNMAVIFYKKVAFRNLFFGDAKELAEKIEADVELACSKSPVDLQLLTQIQSIFSAVQIRLEESLRNRLEKKLNEMKALSLKQKGKKKKESNGFNNNDCNCNSQQFKSNNKNRAKAHNKSHLTNIQEKEISNEPYDSTKVHKERMSQENTANTQSIEAQTVNSNSPPMQMEPNDIHLKINTTPNSSSMKEVNVNSHLPYKPLCRIVDDVDYIPQRKCLIITRNNQKQKGTAVEVEFRQPQQKEDKATFNPLSKTRSLLIQGNQCVSSETSKSSNYNANSYDYSSWDMNDKTLSTPLNNSLNDNRKENFIPSISEFKANNSEGLLKQFNEAGEERESDQEVTSTPFRDNLGISTVDSITLFPKVKNEKQSDKPSENISNSFDTTEHNNKYIDSTKSIDPELLKSIKTKLSEDFDRKQQQRQQLLSCMAYMNQMPMTNNQLFHSANALFMMSYYQMLSKSSQRPFNPYLAPSYPPQVNQSQDTLYQEYLSLKSKEQEQDSSNSFSLNIANFETSILIPMYQTINHNVNKQRNLYYTTYINYKSFIQRVLMKEEVVDKIKPYGSYINNFLEEKGDIDICIVPKCSIAVFSASLNKIRESIKAQSLGEIKRYHRADQYLLLEVIDLQTDLIINITVHSRLLIFNTNLIRLYSLYDQRFHIIGLYIKNWAKVNKIHGASNSYLSSYALLLMVIHFLQKVAEPRVLPNLQAIEEKAVSFEYLCKGETLKANVYYEEDLNKIKAYMTKVNKGLDNKETAAELLVKFYEYYSYYFQPDKKISISRETIETVKVTKEALAFCIEDPFDVNNNPGKSMLLNSNQHVKFVNAMKREINYILNGEYLKRIEEESK